MASSPISLPAFQVPPATSSFDSALHSNLSLPSRSLAAASSYLLYKPQFISYYHTYPLSRVPDSSFTCCHCRSSDSDSESASPGDDESGWDSSIGRFIRSMGRKFDDFMKSRSGDVGMVAGDRDVDWRDLEFVEVEEEFDVDDWDWKRWEKHFIEVEDQERLISVLKSQLAYAVDKEDYEEAARIKVAVAAIASKDTVGSVISYFNKAINEERYQDAAFVRDNAGAGLVGWWAGISDDRKDPYGYIIRISAEHGRYVARSYSPRQLATSKGGAPLFEVFLTLNESGVYKQQAVYLKRKVVSQTSMAFPKFSTSPSGMNTLNPTGGKTDLFDPSTEDPEVIDDGDDSDLAGLSGFPGILPDPVPNLEVKVLKVTLPGKLDQDSVSLMAGQFMEDEEKKDLDRDNVDDGTTDESDNDSDDFDLGAGNGSSDREDQNEIAVKVVVSGLLQKLASRVSPKDLLRVPAKLEKKGRKTFSLTVENDDDQGDSGTKNQTPTKNRPKFKGRRSPHRILFDLEKFVNKGEKIPMKVLKDVGDLISFTLRQAQSKQPLSGSTTFNRIELPQYVDPLNGLYVGAHGPYNTEVIQLRRKFGQWKDNSSTSGADVEFYEYVEAVKITGDPYVPAGEIAFRAKVGKRYQLPHKGIIPEEFGVVARYRGQGRLAEPGFRSPRWVDGELVILDGKYIKSGPVVGFVYWAPEFQFLVFFQRLRLEE